MSVTECATVKAVTMVTAPTNGTLSYVNGVLTYTPNPGFVGTDAVNICALRFPPVPAEFPPKNEGERTVF